MQIITVSQVHKLFIERVHLKQIFRMLIGTYRKNDEYNFVDHIHYRNYLGECP
jgi:hypothetical protein